MFPPNSKHYENRYATLMKNLSSKWHFTIWLWHLHTKAHSIWACCVHCVQCMINSLRPRQNGRLFADDTFKRIFLNENIRISTKNSLKFVPKGLINNIPALVLIMAWRPPGDKPLSEPMLVRSLTHICVTRPQWVNSLTYSVLIVTLRIIDSSTTFRPIIFQVLSWWNIMMKMCPSSFELYFQKRQNNYDVRRKNQLVVPVVRLCLGEKAVRVTGASLWNRLHKDMVQYRLMKCFKGKLKNYYISKYHMWCIDIWSCCVVI